MTNKELMAFLGLTNDATAREQRLKIEASILYQEGLSTKRFQPVYESCTGLLKKFYLYPTFDCPLRCPYCYAEGGIRKTKELPATRLVEITKQAIEAGYKAVVVVGGEPLAYSEFELYLDGIERLERGNCRLVLRSSFGFLIQETLLHRLCKVFDQIVVSLDGEEATHDAVRGKGTWRYATQNIEKALAQGGNIGLNAVLSKKQCNGEDGRFLREYCKKHGIRKLTIQAPLPLGRAKNTQLDYYEWRMGSTQSEHLQPNYSCGLGRNLYMEPDGSVYPCYAWCEAHHKLGDLSTERLADILNRKELLTVLNAGVDTNEKCKNCSVRYLCGGLCKVWVSDKKNINSGAFVCDQFRKRILDMLEQIGVALSENDKRWLQQNDTN